MDNALQDLSAIRKDIERLHEPRQVIVVRAPAPTGPIPSPIHPLSRLVPRGGVFLSWRTLAALTTLGTAAYWIADLGLQAPGAPAKATVAAAAPVETPDWSQTWQPDRSVQPGRSAPGVSPLVTGSVSAAAPPAKPSSDANHHEQPGARRTYHSRETQQQGRVTRRVLATRPAEPPASSSTSRAWTGTFYEK